MAEYSGMSIPAPSVDINNPYTIDPELLYSTHRFTQKGGTIKAGQGVLLLGTILAKDTVSKKWVKYDNGGSNGAGTPVGVLRKTIDTGAEGAKEYQGNIVISGILKHSHVSSANDSSDLSAAVTALNGRVDTVLGTFTF